MEADYLRLLPRIVGLQAVAPQRAIESLRSVRPCVSALLLSVEKSITQEVHLSSNSEKSANISVGAVLT